MRTPKRLQGKATVSHVRSAFQEKELAARIGGRPVRGSGCGNEKGDARLEGVIRLEAKTTMNKSFSVTRDMVKKIEMEAISSNELPVLVVEFLSKEGRPIGEFAVCPTWVLDILKCSKTSKEEV